MDETVALAAALHEACGERTDHTGETCPACHEDAEDALAALHEQGYTIVRQDAPLDLLPEFEVGQVVGELQPGRHRHDRCSVHGDIEGESIDAHARRVHGSSAETIRKARKVVKRAIAREYDR